MKKQVYNPYLPLNVYIPDGEPHVFGDRVYVYGSHDQEGGHDFCVLDYEVWSAPVDDLTNWSCPGIAYRARQDPDWNEKRGYAMYAPDCVRGNDGRYYLYYALAGGRAVYRQPARGGQRPARRSLCLSRLRPQPGRHAADHLYHLRPGGDER